MKAWFWFFAGLLAFSTLSGCGVPPAGDSPGGAVPLAAAPAHSNFAVAQNSPASAPAPDGAALQKASENLLSLSDPKSQSYKIGPLDVLEVTVFKAPELSKVVQVSEAGTINFPLIGELPVSGKSAREVEQVLTKRLGAKYLQNPQISVFVKEHNSQRVTVEGSVKKPGVIPMAGGLTVLQAVALSGGLDESAQNTAVVFRVTDGKRYAARYDIDDIRAGRSDDPPLQSGDVIIVPSSDVKVGLNYVLRVLPLATLVPLL